MDTNFTLTLLSRLAFHSTSPLMSFEMVKFLVKLKNCGSTTYLFNMYPCIHVSMSVKAEPQKRQGSVDLYFTLTISAHGRDARHVYRFKLKTVLLGSDRILWSYIDAKTERRTSFQHSIWGKIKEKWLSFLFPCFSSRLALSNVDLSLLLLRIKHSPS